VALKVAGSNPVIRLLNKKLKNKFKALNGYLNIKIYVDVYKRNFEISLYFTMNFKYPQRKIELR